MQCKYKYQNGKKCQREALEGSEKGYCLLHEDWENKDEEETREQFYKEIEEGETNFEGCVLPGFDLSDREIEGTPNFKSTVIKGDISFDEASISGNMLFHNATIRGDAMFYEVEIEGTLVIFKRAEIKGRIVFIGAKICGLEAPGVRIGKEAMFTDAVIEGDVNLSAATIGSVLFNVATVTGSVWFDEANIEERAIFSGTNLGGNATFDKATIGGGIVSFTFEEVSYLSFESATFKKPEAQEKACREAKIIDERRGDKVSADYHFYREMEAKRKQKHPVINILELPIQYVFGYGVYPLRTVITWLSIVIGVFPFVYWIFHGVKGADTLGKCYYFSIVTATTLGYGDYHPKPGFFYSLAA